jgi:outer membrane protein assembly factor BamA
VLLALATVHAAPVRALVLRRIAALVRTSYGIDVRAESLSYNLLTLSAELRAVELASVDAPAEPFASATALRLTFGVRTLIGDADLQRLSLAAPRIDIRRHGDGTDNLPRASGAPSTRAAVVLPPLAVDDLDVSFQQPPISIAIRGARAQLTSAESGRFSAAVNAERGLAMTVGQRTIDVDTIAGAFEVDTGQLHIRELTASRPGTRLRANGSIAFGAETGTVDVMVNGSSEIGSWWADFSDESRPQGRIDAMARATGRLSAPTIAFEATGRSLVWSDVQVSSAIAGGAYSDGEVSVKTFSAHLAGGTVEGHGTIALDDPRRASRIDARWLNVDARQIPGGARLADRISKDGTAVLEWRGVGPSASPRFDVSATTGIVASGGTTAIGVRGSGHEGRWHVDVVPRDTSVLDVNASADIRLDSRRSEASSIGGRIAIRTMDLPAAIRLAQDFGAPAALDPSTAAGVVVLDATLDGTLGAVQSTGRIIGRSVTISGLPRSDLDVSFGVDGAKKQSTGTFRLLTSAPDASTLASQSGWALSGSLTAAGTWSGPLHDPIIDASVSGRNVKIAWGRSVAVTATDVTLDASLKGPISDLGSEGSLAIGSVAVAGRDIGNVASDLTMTAGVVGLRAHAPKVKAALEATIGLHGALPCDGHLALSDYRIQELGEVMGLAPADASGMSGTISGTVSFKGDLQNKSAMTVTLTMPPIDANMFDVPIALSRGLRATMTGGHLEIEDATITIGGVAVRAHGATSTDQPEGKLSLDLDGDIGTLQPWLTRVNATRELAAAGRMTGHVEAQRSPAGLALTGTLSGALSTLSRRDQTLAKDVRVAIDLTGQRAEVREIAGSVLGGQLGATGGAPLVWLNGWLPPGWHIAQSQIDAPATLEGKASFDLRALLDLLRRPPMKGLSGGTELAVRLTSSRPELAAITGDLRLERAEVKLDELTYAQAEVTRLRFSEGALTIETLDWRGPGSTVTGRGSVGLVGRVESDVRLDVDTELGIVGALMSGRATGRLAGNIELHGRWGAWNIGSESTLRDATWLIPAQRILFAGWSGHVRLTDEGLSLTKLGGTVNGGSVRIDGQLPFEARGGGGGGLTIVARDIFLDVPNGLHSQLGADLVWRPSEAAATLQGKVEITANRYTEPVTRILQLVNSLSLATRGKGESILPPWLADTALEISLAVTDPILMDNSVGTVELLPDLRLAGTVDSPMLSGRIDVVDDGRIRLGGHTYRLRDSRLRFAPADGIVPTLDVIGETRIGEYDVIIRISGTPDRIESAFSSVPPLGERELQSLIVTGQADPSTQAKQAENFAAGAAATDILGFAGKFVGLDSVRIGAADLDLVSKDVSPTQHLTVTKSLGSSFDLIFSDNLEDGSVTWVIVWKPFPLNEIRASSVEDGTRTLEYRRSIVFGPGSPGRPGTGRRAASGQPRAVVDAVTITGAPGFREDEVARELELDAGNRFDVRRWIEDRYRLETFYLDRGFHRVRIVPTRRENADRTQVSLTYDIQRGPATVIEISGDPLPGDALDAMYEAWRGLPIADVVRTEFDRIAREELARRGYYRANVQFDFAPETADLARVTVHVTRGPHTKRLIVAWTGNRHVSTADLDALVTPHRAESEVWLDAQSVAWHVRQLYASRGHLQAQVTVGEPTFRDADATLPIAIDEGVLSRVVDVRLEGVDPARVSDARQALGLSVGDPLGSSAAVEAARRLKAFYAGLGYRNASVTHALTTGEDGSVSIAWAVTEGPLNIVKDVKVVGAETTSTGLVRDAITLEPGAVMSQNALDTTRRNLYDIGSFRRVDFDFGQSGTEPPGAAEAPLTVTIQTEEPQRFQLKYGVQFSVDRSAGQSAGPALGGSVELRDRNFIGRAVQASIGTHWDPDLQTIALLFSSPRIFGKRVRTNVYARDRREQSTVESEIGTVNLDDRRRELTVEQRWRLARVVELAWGYNFSSRHFLLTQDTQPLDIGGLLAGPTFSVVLDRRDSPFDARRGLFHSSSFQFGVDRLGSDLGYVRYLLRQSYYQPLGTLTAAGSVRYGTIADFSGTAPISIIDLLFVAGGTNSVRGYSEGSLSAINVADYALGGTDLLILNGELRFPISKRFGGAAFVDAGNTFASSNDLALGRLAVGAGLGLRIRTPLAPLRLDFGYPLKAEFGQSGVRIHFSIGQMF